MCFMLRVIFLIIGICVIILALSFVFKKHARTILWSSAITLFAGTLLLIGIGVINPVGEDKTGSVEFWGAIITLISGAALAFCAEKLKEKNNGKITEVKNEALIEDSKQEENPVCNEGEVVLPKILDTDTARKVFAKAIEAGYITECGSFYKWNNSKVLLAYMCGSIYCGDKPNYSKIEEKTFWKFGRQDMFPDAELKVLFQIQDLGQSRANRKDAIVPFKSEEIDKFFE